MSVHFTVKFQGGAAGFRQPVMGLAGEFGRIAAGDRAAGAVHQF